MKCHIEYVGKQRNGKKKFWCLTHKWKASDKEGNELKECLSKKKKEFENVTVIDPNKISSIHLLFPNILKEQRSILVINEKEVKGVLAIQNSILEKEDIIGLLLSKLYQVELMRVTCTHCGHYHNDNGIFAITPHRKHLCLYCGHEFYQAQANIGNEFIAYLDVPDIKLENQWIQIIDKCQFDYDVLAGKVTLNGKLVSKICVKKEEISIIEQISKILRIEK